VRGAARRRALAVAVAAVALAALLIPLLAGRATSATPLAYVFNGSQGLRATAVLSSRYNNWLSNASLLGVVPIVITNTQNIPTQAPFDELLNLTVGELGILWGELYSNHFLNMLFVNSSGKPLYAWVMNYTPNWVAVWVKLPNGIPAGSSVTIYLEVTNTSQYPYTGLAPYLTSTYGQYDNGQYVFPVYYNFAGTSLPQGLVFTVLSNPSGASGSYSVNNGLNITNKNGQDFWDNYFMISLVYINKTFNFTATPLLFEAIVKGIGGSVQQWSKAGLVYMNNITTSSTSNGEVDMAITSSHGYATQWQSGTSYIAPSANWNGG